MPKTTQITPNGLDARFAPNERTGPLGRAVRLVLALGFAAALGTLVDQGGAASVRDPEALTDAPFLVLTVVMVVLYAVLSGELAKVVGGEAVARKARRVTVPALAVAAAVAAVVGEVRAGAVWGSPLSDLVWALDAAILAQTVVALLLAVVLGTPGCEIGVWSELAARLLGRPASPPLCIIGLHYLDEWELRRRSARRDACYGGDSELRRTRTRARPASVRPARSARARCRRRA